MPDYHYLIVGGGMTADAAARGIRELDPNRDIGVLAEPGPFGAGDLKGRLPG